MLDTSLKRENSGEFEEDLPIEVNLPCNEDLQVEPMLRPGTPLSIFSHQMLLNRIELQLPKDDHVKYDSRARKLDWDQIKFKDYSSEDCKKYWEHIQVHQGQKPFKSNDFNPGKDPEVPNPSGDDSRRPSLAQPALDQLLQVKGKFSVKQTKRK